MKKHVYALFAGLDIFLFYVNVDSSIYVRGVSLGCGIFMGIAAIIEAIEDLERVLRKRNKYDQSY